MELRSATAAASASARDAAHCGCIQAGLAMPSRRLRVYHCEERVTGSGSSGFQTGLHFAVSRRSNSGRRLLRIENRLLRSSGFQTSLQFGGSRRSNAGGRVSRIENRLLRHGAFRSNGALVLRVVQALSSGKGDGGGGEPTQRTKAVGDASQQPTSPASASSTSSTTTVTPKKQQRGGFLALVLSIPSSIWRQIVLPLSNFGFGKTSIWEGGVGLFVLSGAVLLAITLIWVKGVQIRSKNRKYEAVIEFASAQGITVGTSVRIRGVDVGTVVGMKPSLERIDVMVQLADTGIVIPRNALVEVNQSGLISETLIDVTPQDPIPQPTVGPLDEGCKEEGMIVCDRERIKGEQGVSLDELVGICTKIAKGLGVSGVSNMYSMAERVTAAIAEAQPLLGKVEILAGDIEPLLKLLKDGLLLKDVERLTKVMAEAGADLRTLNKSVLTTENIEHLRQSVGTLTKTLKHIESITQDVSGLTGDPGTKKNLRQLIESLSRLVMD